MLFPAQKERLMDAVSRSAPLPTPPERLFARLDELGITYKIYNHEPVHTVAESAHLAAVIPGLHCRNLFLRDRAGKMFLAVAGDHTPIDLKKLAAMAECGRLSFGSPERLWRVLGVRPGSVCPFALMNDRDRAVTVLLDRAMMAADLVNYHPLENHMTIGLVPADLLKFIESCGHRPHIMDLGA
jgi:Ala-tRNA(Pro) deacylase